MKRSHVNSHRSCSRPAILVLGVFLLFLLGFTLTSPRRPSGSATEVSTNRNERILAGKSRIPRFAYLITGTKGDGKRVKRLLRAIHHHRNYYLLHLDLEASDEERLELAKYVRSEKKKLKNVMVMGLADLVTEKGPTMLASTLHGVAILLKKARDWDWFINLSSSDYPLMPQDDVLDSDLCIGLNRPYWFIILIHWIISSDLKRYFAYLLLLASLPELHRTHK